MGFPLKRRTVLGLDAQIDRGVVVCNFGDSHYPDVLSERFALK